ncbi:MAG TPA: hypothetical protein VKP88_08615 [Candidatus Paceibacterota bacterium]|nr:hypothetical protein [Candidatus Paceibacterota bacterium]
MSNYGEYYMERSPEEIADLRAENRGQNRRLERVEERVTELRVALVGIDDRNGLRGELRNHKQHTEEQLTAIEAKVDKIVPAILKGVVTAIGAAGTIVGIIVGVLRVIG